MPALVFRCDESAETGLGHFARCRDLARLLRARLPGLAVTFAGELSPFSQRQVAELGFSHLSMDRGEALLSERLRLAAGDRARLIVDSYRLDGAELARLEQWPSPWGVFDDFGGHDYAGGQLVINARVTARAERYRARYVAAGAGFFAATPELVVARNESRPVTIAGTPARVLLFIGGSDFSGVGPRLASAVSDTFPTARVRLVQSQPLQERFERVEQVPLGPGLEAELAQSSLVVAGGGRLKYEACYCQIPCASVSQTNGQAEDTAELAARGLCLDLGLAASFEHERVVSALRELWRPEVLAAMRAAQSRSFPGDAPLQLTALVTTALQLG